MKNLVWLLIIILSCLACHNPQSAEHIKEQVVDNPKKSKTKFVPSEAVRDFGPCIASFELAESYGQIYHTMGRGYIYVMWNKPKTPAEAPNMILDDGLEEIDKLNTPKKTYKFLRGDVLRYEVEHTTESINMRVYKYNDLILDEVASLLF